jgi:myosin heavy subunit
MISLSWGAAFIGVLDIYGFENFATNGFEQLLINYANEKLQNHFNKHIFQIEQAEYESESIDWSYISFYDNLQCVDLIDGKMNGKTGLFQTLDDSNASGRLDVNANFLAQVNNAWSGANKHPNFLAPRFNSDQIFGVLHYAGEVYYNINGFAEKNRDSMNADMKDLFTKSTNPLMSSIMAASNAAELYSGLSPAVSVSEKMSSMPPATQKGGGAGGAGKKRGGAMAPEMSRKQSVNKLKEDSISKQFTQSLRQLCDTLDSTEPHFIRCVKPNGRKQPDSLHARETLQQVQ